MNEEYYGNALRECRSEIQRLRGAARELEDELEKVKDTLFKQTRNRAKHILKDNFKTDYAKDDLCGFEALYQVILDADLKDEFEAYRAGEKEIDR